MEGEIENNLPEKCETCIDKKLQSLIEPNTERSINKLSEGSDSSPSNFSSDRVPVINAQNYVRTIRRRGNIYMVKESAENVDGTDQMISDLYSESLDMSISANRKARLLKLCNVMSNIFLVISGAVIGVLTLNENASAMSIYIASVLGFTITAVQTIMSTFSVEKRGVILRDISHNLRKLSRKIKTLQNSEMSPKDKMKKLEEYYTEIDEMDMLIFDNTATNIPKGKHRSSDISSDSSDRGYRQRPTMQFATKPDDQIIVQMMNT